MIIQPFSPIGAKNLLLWYSTGRNLEKQAVILHQIFREKILFCSVVSSHSPFSCLSVVDILLYIAFTALKIKNSCPLLKDSCFRRFAQFPSTASGKDSGPCTARQGNCLHFINPLSVSKHYEGRPAGHSSLQQLFQTHQIHIRNTVKAAGNHARFPIAQTLI